MVATATYAANYVSNTALAGVATSGTFAFASGSRIWVAATAERNNHTNGLDGAFVVDDTATTNNPTWTTLHTGAIWDNGNFDGQIKVWSSSALTAAETFAITVDGDSGSTSQFRYRIAVVQLTGADGTILSGQQDSDNQTSGTAFATDTGTLTAGELQLYVAMRYGGGGNTWNANPTNFTTLNTQDELHLMQSTANTVTNVSFNGTTTFPKVAWHGQLSPAAAAASSLVIPSRANRQLLVR